MGALDVVGALYNEAIKQTDLRVKLASLQSLAAVLNIATMEVVGELIQNDQLLASQLLKEKTDGN